MKNIAELNLLKSNLIIHKLAACVLLTGFLLRLLLKQRKIMLLCCYFFVSFVQLSRCTNALCSSTLSFPRCGASCGNGESRHPSGGNMHGIYRVHGAPPLLPALLQVLLPAPKCQKLQTYLLKWWSSKRFFDVFLPWDGGEKNKCIQFQYSRLPELLLRKVECQNYAQR